MKISKPLIYCNVIALVVNAILVWLTIVRVFTPMLGLTMVVGFLLGAVWCSCLVNGKLPKKPSRQPLYAAPTQGSGTDMS